MVLLWVGPTFHVADATPDVGFTLIDQFMVLFFPIPEERSQKAGASQQPVLHQGLPILSEGDLIRNLYAVIFHYTEHNVFYKSDLFKMYEYRHLDKCSFSFWLFYVVC